MKFKKVLQAIYKANPDFERRLYRVAKALGTEPANLYGWLKTDKVDPRFVVALVVLGQGSFTEHDLRPDVFPAPGASLPQHPNSGKGLEYAGNN